MKPKSNTAITNPKRSTTCIRVYGHELRSVRESLGWTQEFAAFRAGYSDRWIRKLERGGPVSRRGLEDILDAYRDVDSRPIADAERYIDRHRGETADDRARAWFERAYNRREISAVDEFIHDDVVLIAEGQTRHGKPAVRRRLSRLLAAFNPLQLVVERVVWEGNTAVAFWQARKRHVGDFLGIPATGRWVNLRGNSMAEFRGDKIALVRDHWDLHLLIQQLQGRPQASI